MRVAAQNMEAAVPYIAKKAPKRAGLKSDANSRNRLLRDLHNRKLKTLKIDSLCPNDHGVKTLCLRQLSLLADNFKQLGIAQPIVIDEEIEFLRPWSISGGAPGRFEAGQVWIQIALCGQDARARGKIAERGFRSVRLLQRRDVRSNAKCFAVMNGNATARHDTPSRYTH